MTLQASIAFFQRIVAALERAQPLALLAARGYVAQVFLVLQVLLALGLGGRFAALGLSVVNAVAVFSLAEIAPAALQLHILWACLLIGVLLWGPGRWSLDRFVLPWLQTTRQTAGYTRAA